MAEHSCFITHIDFQESLVCLDGYICELGQESPSIGYTGTIRKLSWEDFQRQLQEWQFNKHVACTFVSKDEIYITEVTFTEEMKPFNVSYEMDWFRSPNSGLQFFGCPEIVFQHFLGQLLH